MSLLVLTNDFVTMSLATGLAPLIPGILLVVEGMNIIVMGMRYFHLEWEKLRTLVALDGVTWLKPV